MYRLTITHSELPTWQGEEGIDTTVRKVLDKTEVASGYGFGERELVFEYPTKTEAKRAEKKLKVVLGTIHTKVSEDTEVGH